MMYKYQKLIFLLLFFARLYYNRAYSQTEAINKDTFKNVIGRFNSPEQEDNKFTSEAITLNADSTFEYQMNTEFLKIKANGYWHISGNDLILNSSDKREKINVEEKKNRNNKIKFDVAYKTDEPLYYQLYLITNEDTLHIEDVFADTVINRTTLKGFYIIDTRGLKYPTYFLKKRKSNYFRVRLEKNRIFDNEVWHIKDNGTKLQPIGFNGNFMNYCLIKQ